MVVQFTQDAHEAIANGAVTLTFRLWKRPHAKVGGRYTVGHVVIEVDDIELVPFHTVTRTDVKRAGAADRGALRERAAHAGPIDDDTLLYRIEFHVAGDRPEPMAGPADPEAVDGVIAELDRMDARSPLGPWTRRVLTLIGAHEGTVSTELAAAAGRARMAFKADVRKLKALGLTESLEVGYRLSELGREVVARDS